MGRRTGVLEAVVQDSRILGCTVVQGHKFQVNTETLTGAKTLVASDYTVQFLDPGGSGRDVNLPAEAVSVGLAFYIFNTADAAEALTVKDDGGSTVTTMARDEGGWVVCDGTTWYGSAAPEASLPTAITATTDELNYLDIATLGTGAASKAVVLDSGEDYTWPSAGVLTYGVLNDGVTALAATALELNRANDVSARLVAAGASLAVTLALHDGKTIALDTSAGSALTLPAATGTGARIRVIVSVTASGGSHTIVCAGTDEYAGVIYQVDTDSADAVAAYPAIAADDYDTITLNGTTTGGLIGDWIELEDVVSGTWALRGHTNANGEVATPLSAA